MRPDPSGTAPRVTGPATVPRAGTGPPPGAARVPAILHINAGNLYGGIETLVATLARNAHVRDDLRPEFALCFPGRLRDELLGAGAIVHDLGAVRFRNPASIIRARRRLAGLLRGRRVDAVVLHACWAHALMAPVARRAGCPVVFWQHDFVGSGHWVERLAARTRPDFVLSNSRASVATLPALFPGVPSEVVYYPVAAPPRGHEIGARDATRRELGTPPGATVIIQACRMERWKGHPLLLDALGRLDPRLAWVAWIVGGAQRPSERAYLAELEAQACRLGLGDRVRFLGQRDDVARLLGAADIHAQPNLGPEPFGIAFIEALYAGLPVISTRMGGAVEVVTADCGVLVEPGDPTALAAALDRLVARPADRARLGGAGPRRAAELCDPARSLSRLRDSLYGSVLPRWG